MLCWRKINYKLLLVVVCGNMNSVDVDVGVDVGLGVDVDVGLVSIN